MAIRGTYERSPWDWVADQVELYEQTGGKEGADLNVWPDYDSSRPRPNARFR